MNKRRIVVGLLFTLIILAQLACEDGIVTLSPGGQGDYAAAQATLDYGQRQAMELSYQATTVSLNMAQAANAAAQTTRDYNQRLLVELSIRGTEVSQNMAQAVAAQKFSIEQTQMAWNVAAAAQSQTAQAQMILAVQATQTAQANATLTAYPLTATPQAALQADILQTRNETHQRVWWEQSVVTPLLVVLITLVVLLLIVGGVLAYRRLIPAMELRLRTIPCDDNSHLLLMDGGMIVDSAHPQLPSYGAVQVEIVGSSEPSITNWIVEAERKLHSDGRMQS